MNGVWEVPTMVDMAEKGTLGFDWGAVQIPTLLGTTATWRIPTPSPFLRERK